MKTFLDFLKEESIDVPFKLSDQNVDTLNSELEVLTDKPYQNAPIFLAQLRGTFERYGVLLPATMTDQFLNLDAEITYALPQNPGFYIYIVYNTNDSGYVDGYAQVVSQDELADLKNMSTEDLLGDEDEAPMKPRYLPARRDDDSGNSNEYV
jgi:hypothetical protein